MTTPADERTISHPETGECLRRDVRRYIVRFGGLEESVMQPGWWGDAHASAMFSMADVEATAHVLASLKKRASTGFPPTLTSPDDISG